MQEHTVDLLTISFYQQMAQVFYVDLGMMKWAGMLLSEHIVSIPGQVAPPVRLCDTAIPLERYHHSGK